MISSSRLFGKGCFRPAVAKLVPNRALMIRTKPFLLCFIGPYDPGVQGFIELARSDHSLTNPVKKRPAWDVKLSGQFGGPVLATCGIRRPEWACENPSCCLLLLVDSSEEEYNLKH